MRSVFTQSKKKSNEEFYKVNKDTLFKLIDLIQSLHKIEMKNPFKKSVYVYIDYEK